MTLMTQAVPPRTSQLLRIVDLEHRDDVKEKRIVALEEAHKAFDLKLDGILDLLNQVKGGLWLAGKFVASITTIAIVAGACVGVLHAMGH